MVHAVIIVAFVLSGLASAMDAGQGVAAGGERAWGWAWASAWGWPIAGAAGLTLLVRWACLRLDRAGDARVIDLVHRAIAAYLSAGIAGHGAALLLFGWFAEVRRLIGEAAVAGELAAGLPVAFMLTAAFASRYPIDRRVREATLISRLDRGEPIHAEPGLLGSVVFQWRHQALFILVPLVMISVWMEVASAHAARAGWGPLAAGAAQFAGALGVFALSPLVLRFVWDTVRLRAGGLHDRLDAMARAHGVRLSGVLIWRTGGTIVNAAVTGLLPVLRYVVLSDALLERMPSRQVEAVAAHEIAHVRERHLAWMAGLVVAVVTVVGFPFDVAAQRLPGVLAGAAQLAGGVVSLAATLAALGAVSRRFEWQADAFAVRHMARAHGDAPGVIDRDAVAAMTSALALVAVHAGVSPTRFTWRHGSIADRQRRLRRLEGLPWDRLPIDRRVRVVKAVILMGVLAAAGVILGEAVAGGSAVRGGVP